MLLRYSYGRSHCRPCTGTHRLLLVIPPKHLPPIQRVPAMVRQASDVLASHLRPHTHTTPIHIYIQTPPSPLPHTPAGTPTPPAARPPPPATPRSTSTTHHPRTHCPTALKGTLHPPQSWPSPPPHLSTSGSATSSSICRPWRSSSLMCSALGVQASTQTGECEAFMNKAQQGGGRQGCMGARLLRWPRPHAQLNEQASKQQASQAHHCCKRQWWWS